jgi:DNA-binding SARP family transcriptional activator
MRLRVLGPLEFHDGNEWRGVSASKWRALLAVLVIEADRVVSLDRIAVELWGDAQPKTVDNQIHGYVARLRRLLSDGRGHLLVTQSPGYRLLIGPDDNDIGRFVALVEQGRSALRDGAVDQATSNLAEALALWRGSAFQDVPATPLVQAETQRLNELRASAWEDFAEARLLRGEHAAVAAELAELIAEEPLRERARELQMLALYRNGRQAEALAVYSDVRRLLADQLGVDPSLSLQRLHGQILGADPALTPADTQDPPSGTALPVHQLPPDVPDFAGRAEPLGIVTEVLAGRVTNGPPPIVVVTGAPGVGKSSLAVHAAHGLRADFPDGQLYMDLAGTSTAPRDPTVVLGEALRALGVIDRWIPEGLDARASLYRSLLAHRRMLLVLDDAANSGQVRPLLPPSDTCAVVITSRLMANDLVGARLVDLDVLESSEARQLLVGIVGAERVDAEPDQAEAILRFCGYLPLAIRICGGRLAGRTSWPLRVLRERLDDESRRLNELRVGELGVRASFDLSLHSLPVMAVQAFSFLGLLGAQTVPGWVLGPLLDRQDTDEVLDLLVDANLVRLAGTDAIGQPRYRLHDLLRTYAVEAAETVAPRVRTAALSRLLSAWLHLVEEASGSLPPSLFQPPRGTSPRYSELPPQTHRLLADPTAWFDAERVSLLNAVSLATEWKLDELAWELAATMVPHYDLRSMHEDWHLSHHMALRVVRDTGNRRGEATLRVALAQVQIYRDLFDEAGDNLRRARQLCREIGDRRGEALASSGFGTIERVLGRHVKARVHVERALELAIASGDRALEAQLRCSVAMINLAEGRTDLARVLFDQAVGLARRLGDAHREAVILRKMSQLHRELGDAEGALACLDRARTIFEDLDDERCTAYTLMNMGPIYAERRDRTQTTAALTGAAALFERDGDRLNEATCWQVLGELHATQDDPATARLHLTRALRLCQSFDAEEQMSEIRTRLHQLER